MIQQIRAKWLTWLVRVVLMMGIISGCARVSTPETVSQTVEVERQEVVVTYEPVDREAAPMEEAVEEAFADEPPVAQPSTGGTDEPNDQPYGDVFYKKYGVNPRVDTQDDALSTFAVDVDTASYTVMRRYLRDGYLPPAESVRVEEYVNFFDQAYASPTEQSFALYLDGAPSPYADNYHLVRVGIQGYEVPPEERKDAALTFVIDISGSMARENRLDLVKEALYLLVDQLRPTDKVGIVVYGNRGQVILEPTLIGERPRRIKRAIARLQPGGSTNAEEGLVLGYKMANRAFIPGGINRVILCSDGVANVGRTGPESILKEIRRYAEEDIYLTTVGFGMGNFNDVLMERLANDGDGFYAYVDDIREAERVFVTDLTSTLQVIARDAKIQVEFDPEVVRSYRLLGYENRAVADEDFRNDAVDAGELGVGHSVTALYELKFEADASPDVTAMTVRLRWEDPDTGEVVELARSLSQDGLASVFEATAPRFQLSVIVAQYAEVLRESYWAAEMGTTLGEIASQAQRVAEYLPGDDDVQEFAQLASRAPELKTTTH